jgi:prepilin signal peptidase PulO-like enzyme (type II secretory pathway)
MTTILFALFGACFGSFANMLIHRLPLQEEVVKTPSHCPKCSGRLGFKNLIPLLSYLWQRGKCHECKAVISSRYFWVELACALLFALIAYQHGVTPLAFLLCAVGLTLVILIAIDLEHMIIPDEIQIALVVLGIGYVWLTDASWVNAFMLAATGVLFGLFLRWLMFVWKKREGLGWGDVKFLGVAGLYLDWHLLTAFCFLSGIAGIITAPILRNADTKEYPFGPSLAIALMLLLLEPNFIHSQFQHVIDFLVEFIVVPINN